MEIKLTGYTNAGGCGCKISLSSLENILDSQIGVANDNLIVGFQDRDDAAVYSYGDGKSVVSSLDFFSPIVDDPFSYGQISAANAISDIYAMGGRPLFALAILGFPVDDMSNDVAIQIMRGAADICKKAEVLLTGGHTINNPQPIFGLSVNGDIENNRIKRNNGAKEGDYLFLTKPLGTGILSTALKLNKLAASHYEEALMSMIKLNDIGIAFGELNFVTAMTDVTGFGLLGHLLEICNASNLRAVLNYNSIKTLSGSQTYLRQGIVTGGGKRNWQSYHRHIEGGNDEMNAVLSDPQTNGGLLVSVDAKFKDEFQKVLNRYDYGSHIEPIGRLHADNEFAKIMIQ